VLARNLSGKKEVNGCSDSAVINITSSNNCSDNILFPTAFSPNGDGLNDNFGPLPLRNLPSLKNYTLQIYNRYGQIIFNSTNPYEKWDGMYKGQLFDTGSFTWRSQYIYNSSGQITQQGNITIVH
jgi:gliding motility-associated-like protein